MEEKCILLDTSFLIRLLNENDPLHSNALGFYQYFLEKGFRLKISTISISEYCVKGKLEELPLKDLEIIPFNTIHAVKAGEFARLVFEKRYQIDLSVRLIIPNDTKLFAQAHVEDEVIYFATSDAECIKIYDLLKQDLKIDFQIINIRNTITSELRVFF